MRRRFGTIDFSAEDETASTDNPVCQVPFDTARDGWLSGALLSNPNMR